MAGTSMATPHVAGAWAILKQKSPTASVASILTSFQATGAAVTTKAGDLAGAPPKRIDVLATLNATAATLIAPSGLSASASSTGAITLNWTDNSTDETGFEIKRKTGANGIYSLIGTAGAGVTTYPDSGLSDGTTYTYQVRAINAAGKSGYSLAASATTPLAPPSALSAVAASSSQINLSWTDNSSTETGISIERATTSGGSYTLIGTAASNATSYSDTGLPSSTTYYYRVSSYSSSLTSGYSNEAGATTPAPPPSGGGGGGCFIATAAFGTPLEKHVRILRTFRDRSLLPTAAGRAFVNFYYKISPPIADRIAQSEVLRFFTRGSLLPLVGMAYLTVAYGATATLLGMLFVILSTVAALWTLRRKKGVVRPPIGLS